MTPGAEQIIARCRRIARCTEVPGETTRLFLSPAMAEVHTLMRGWMKAAGMSIRLDAAGNLRGLYPGPAPDAPRLLLGSHLDTVPNAGAFDGVLGVVLGIAVVEELRGRSLPFAIEVIGFSEEEGIRFGKPFLGSLALIGSLDATTLARTDRHGISVAAVLRSFGCNPLALEDACLAPRTFAFLECHIEQGPALESQGHALCVVASIAGQTRLQLRFTGEANHAGTTPMPLRHDALAAAAQWIVTVEWLASREPSLVATVGRIEAAPGAPNVIPGEVLATLDIRHPDDAVRHAATAALQHEAASAAATRGVTLTVTELHQQAAVAMDPHLVSTLAAAAEQAGFSAPTMTSGAGHDAMILAPHVPSVMLFLRTPGGLSHHPDEDVSPGDVAAALATATHFITLLASETAAAAVR